MGTPGPPQRRPAGSYSAVSRETAFGLGSFGAQRVHFVSTRSGRRQPHGVLLPEDQFAWASSAWSMDVIDTHPFGSVLDVEAFTHPSRRFVLLTEDEATDTTMTAGAGCVEKSG